MYSVSKENNGGNKDKGGEGERGKGIEGEGGMGKRGNRGKGGDGKGETHVVDCASWFLCAAPKENISKNNKKKQRVRKER